jgi:hypothetical protein
VGDLDEWPLQEHAPSCNTQGVKLSVSVNGFYACPPLNAVFLVCREWIYPGLRTHTLTDVSIPFFFEPNFDSKVAPLEAARRIQKDLSLSTGKHHTSQGSQQAGEKIYEPVVYGEFLRGKVTNNFVSGGSKYN